MASKDSSASPAAAGRPDVDAAAHLAERLGAFLQHGHRVVWLVSGGSAVPVAGEAFALLAKHYPGHLVIGQIDERYGAVGHADANWPQLLAAGIAARPGIELLPILTGAPMEATVQTYASALAEQFDTADAVIGLLGIGADGHTAGILPHSPGVISPDLVVGYHGPDFERITLTGAGLAKLNEAVVFAVGAAKGKQLRRLVENLPATDQPAQLLKAVRHVTIFTDTKLAGEPA